MTDGNRARLAYIGSFTTGGGAGITVAAVDPATGGLSPRAAADGPVNPSCLALAPGTGVLYAVSDTEAGTAAAFRTKGDGLAPLGEPVAVGGSGPTHLSVVGRRLLTANYGSGSVSSLPLCADGTLTGPPAVLTHQGSGPDPDRQRGPHAHQVLPDPTGRWVLGVDLGADTVRVHRLDPATGALHVHSTAPLPAGSGPRHLAFHPDGRTAYVLHELVPRLTVCAWDGGSGRLTPLSDLAVTPEGAEPRAFPSVVTVAPDGRFAWVAVRGTDTLVTLSLSDGPRRPRITDRVECGGSWPRDLVAGPDGRLLYVSNEWSGDVTWFAVDPVSGRPSRAGALPVPAAACVVLA
ncbi:lactonase family protein [Streptomyces pactum]|uniref:lactonase family protein n=1 Tax=Streptomyces pactum TaxID=68249 RepID=UPI0036F91112